MLFPRRLKDDDACTLERRLIDADPNHPMPAASRQALRTWAAAMDSRVHGGSGQDGKSAIEILRWLPRRPAKWLSWIAGGTCLVMGTVWWESREARNAPSSADPLSSLASEPSSAPSMNPPPSAVTESLRSSAQLPDSRARYAEPLHESALISVVPKAAPQATSVRPRSGKSPSTATTAPALVEKTEHPASKKATLAEEMKWLEDARAHLRTGRPRESLGILDRYQEQFPHGALNDEAKVMRINALVKLGDSAAATRVGQEFLENHQDDLYTARVRSLLGSLSQEGTPK